jgi:hypothetical protein
MGRLSSGSHTRHLPRALRKCRRCSNDAAGAIHMRKSVPRVDYPKLREGVEELGAAANRPAAESSASGDSSVEREVAKPGSEIDSAMARRHKGGTGVRRQLGTRTRYLRRRLLARKRGCCSRSQIFAGFATYSLGHPRTLHFHSHASQGVHCEHPPMGIERNHVSEHAAKGEVLLCWPFWSHGEVVARITALYFIWSGR